MGYQVWIFTCCHSYFHSLWKTKRKRAHLQSPNPDHSSYNKPEHFCTIPVFQHLHWPGGQLACRWIEHPNHLSTHNKISVLYIAGAYANKLQLNDFFFQIRYDRIIDKTRLAVFPGITGPAPCMLLYMLCPLPKPAISQYFSGIYPGPVT